MGIKFASKVATTEIKFSDVYSVELINHGLIRGSNVSNARRCLKGQHDSEVCSIPFLGYVLSFPHSGMISIVFTLMQIYRFTVHGFQRSKTPSIWVLATYTFGHKDLHTCQMWVNQINASLDLEQGRPKNLLVCFVLGQTLHHFLVWILSRLVG